jgi:hypothetical protein
MRITRPIQARHFLRDGTNDLDRVAPKSKCRASTERAISALASI